MQQLTVVLGSLYGAHVYAPEVFCWIHDRRAWAQVGKPRTFIHSPHEAGRCRAPGGTPDGDGGSKDFIPMRVIPLQSRRRQFVEAATVRWTSCLTTLYVWGMAVCRSKLVGVHMPDMQTQSMFYHP